MLHPLIGDRRGIVLYMTAWLLLGLVLALPATGLEVGSWRSALIAFLPPFLLFGFLCLAAWYPSRANPLHETGPGRLAVVHLSAALLSSLVWLLLANLWTRWLEPSTATEIHPEPSRYLAIGVLLFLLATALHYVLLAFEESRLAQERALELRVLAREAELAAYKSQIDPHFLFNCLNSISSLCGSRPADAREMTIRLGDFLRSSLRLADRDFISLEEEMELARKYLEIERTRFGERLDIRIEVVDEAVDCKVPALLLQPLVENSIKHGISQLVEGGTVELTARTTDNLLSIEVTNPIDPDAAAAPGDGIGLGNVSGRLGLLYRGRAHFEVQRDRDRFEVRVDLPREAANVS